MSCGGEGGGGLQKAQIKINALFVYFEPES